MRIGLISDIHGNRVALDAVLEDIERSGGVDQLICLGDVAVGPQPNESLARIRELECPVIMGNWDACFLDGMPEVHDEIGLKLVETAEWWASFLSDGDKDFIRSFQRTLEVPLDDGASMFCFHGSPDLVRRLDLRGDSRRGPGTHVRRDRSARPRRRATRTCR